MHALENFTWRLTEYSFAGEALESVPSSRAVTAGLAFRLREENELAMMKERRPDAITIGHSATTEPRKSELIRSK
jgi:hypothetical protein